jgi:alkylation response protein AidB-like acyl-CoA dehydrogenase
MEGFERGKKLDKIGRRGNDTAELILTDVRVPVANLLGEENRGFYHLMRNLPAERLGMAIHAAAESRRALELTRKYAAEQTAFGTATGACSCTAATATSTSTRSPGSGGTRACSACTAAPPRSCAT